MNKTLMLAMALLVLGGVATTASAESFRCATPTPELAYVVQTCNYVGTGAAAGDALATVGFAAGEAGEIATHDYVSFPSGAHHCATTSPELVLVVEVCNYVLGGGASGDAVSGAAFASGEAGETVAFLEATYGPRLP